jgi:arylsulfatase A-like enzyme
MAVTCPSRTSAFPFSPAEFRDAGYDTGYFGKWHVPAPIHDQDWSGFNTLGAIRDNRVDFDIVAPCLDFIKKDREAPFLAFASFVNPHDICEFARMLSDIPDELKNGPIPDLPPEDQLPPLPANWRPPEDEPEAVRASLQPRDNEARSIRRAPGAGPRTSAGASTLWAYYRMVELVDRYVGELLDGLEAAGLAEDTLIVFTSDHGDGMARHQWNQKTIFYDEVSRVPFIIARPGQEPSCAVNTQHLVNLGDRPLPDDHGRGRHRKARAPERPQRSPGSPRAGGRASP